MEHELEIQQEYERNLIKLFINSKEEKTIDYYQNIFNYFEQNNGKFKTTWNKNAFFSGIFFILYNRMNIAYIHSLIPAAIIYSLVFMFDSRTFITQIWIISIGAHILIGVSANYLFYYEYAKAKSEIEKLTPDIETRFFLMTSLGRASTYLDSIKNINFYLFLGICLLSYFFLYIVPNMGPIRQ